MDARRVVAGVGRTFIAAGVLILLFVAYQLWGTGLAEARSQDALREDFERYLEAEEDPVTSTSTTTAVDGEEPPGDPGAEQRAIVPRARPEGSAVAIIRIPRIDVEKAVVEGVTTSALKKGPGHYPGTPMPGEPGNAAIAGHRTTYGAPFFRFDELEPGDPIYVTTRAGEFTYRVTETTIVKPHQREVLDPTEDNRLTLTTCHPRYSARLRMIVVANLTDEPAPPPPAPADPVEGAEPTEGGADGGEEPIEIPGEELPQELDAGLSGDPAARGPALAWGSLAALVWLLTWLASKKVGRIPAYSLGVPVFLVVLFVFFENFARLLPPNI